MNKGKGKFSILGNTHPAVVAVWAALHAASALLPTIPLLGTGTSFSVGIIFAPLAGVFFGPVAGAAATAVGAFIGSIIAPHTAWIGLATFVPEMFAALVAGFMSRGGKAWPLSLVIVGTGAVLWLATATGRAFPAYLFGYVLSAIAMVIGGIWGRKWLLSNKFAFQFLMIWLCSFAAMQGGSTPVSTFIGVVVYGFPPELYKALLFLQPGERAVFSLVAAIVGIPLLKGLPKVGVYVGPQDQCQDDPVVDEAMDED